MSLHLSRPLVYLITPGACEASEFPRSSDQLLDTVKAAVDSGIDLIQIREKRLPGRLLFELTRRASEIVKGSRTKLLVNDRFDIAVAAGAGGVHLTSASLEPRVVRDRLPGDRLIGMSMHAGDDPASAAEADFVLFGPVYATPGKGDGVGDGVLSELSQISPVPVLAVGGIDESNFRRVLDSGAAGFAAIRALNDAGSRGRIMRVLER